MAIPAKLQNDLKQFQRLQQELSAATQQRMQIELKLRELTHTLEEVQRLGDDAVIYRSVGSLLLRAPGRKQVEGQLSEEKETLEVRMKAVERQEHHLKERYGTMQEELTQALQAAGVTPVQGGPE